MERWSGPALAIASALLFGASTPLAKVLVGEADPWVLAGLLYLGSGVGLALWRGARWALGRPGTEAPLRGCDWGWLAGAILAGGIAAPVLLLWGLATSPAATASLLLNLEGVLTALLAWFVFREHFDRRIALGMAAIGAGGVLLAWSPEGDLGVSVGSLAIAGACLGWAIDNNLTRKVSAGDPIQIAMAKGLVAGTVNVGLGLAQGATIPGPATVLATAAVGLMGYGVSLALYVLALRHIGASRTSAYFSLAPFLGAAIAVAGLGEPVTGPVGVAAGLMVVGVWLHLTERHQHFHEHDPMVHDHRHMHDEHHRHAHGPADPPGEPHSHAHTHAPLGHSHPHYPDIHHRHGH